MVSGQSFEAAGRVRMEEVVTCDGVPCFELVCKPIRIFTGAVFSSQYHISHHFRFKALQSTNGETSKSTPDTDPSSNSCHFLDTQLATRHGNILKQILLTISR